MRFRGKFRNLTSQLHLVLFATTLSFSGARAVGQESVRTPTPGEVQLDRTTDLLLRSDYFKSPGPIRIILTDSVTGEKTTFLADDAEGTIGGDIIVRGAVRVDDSLGTMSGRNLTYNMANETGSILEARVTARGLRVGGRKVELLPGRVIKATGATFTTCEKEGTPDYRIAAREIELNVPRRKVKARGVTFYIGKTRVGSSRVDLQACKLEYSIVSPK